MLVSVPCNGFELVMVVVEPKMATCPAVPPETLFTPGQPEVVAPPLLSVQRSVLMPLTTPAERTLLSVPCNGSDVPQAAPVDCGIPAPGKTMPEGHPVVVAPPFASVQISAPVPDIVPELRSLLSVPCGEYDVPQDAPVELAMPAGGHIIPPPPPPLAPKATSGCQALFGAS